MQFRRASCSEKLTNSQPGTVCTRGASSWKSSGRLWTRAIRRATSSIIVYPNGSLAREVPPRYRDCSDPPIRRLGEDSSSVIAHLDRQPYFGRGTDSSDFPNGETTSPICRAAVAGSMGVGNQSYSPKTGAPSGLRPSFPKKRAYWEHISSFDIDRQ